MNKQTEMEQRIRVVGPCWYGDCDCMKYDNALVKDVGMPPFHDGCVCVVEDVTQTKEEGE